MRIPLLITVAAIITTACSQSERPLTNEAVAPTEIEIVGHDYAFTAPAELPAGRTTFRFNNKGKVRHELNISLLRQGVPVERLVETVRADKTVKDLIDGPVGVLFGEPGKRSDGAMITELVAGREYAVICIFRDSAGARQHFDKGMYSVIRVGMEPANAAVSPESIDTIVGTDYAFEYPRTMAPGRHTFLFRNAGRMRHQFSVSLLVEGATMEKLLALEKAGVNVDSLFDKDFGLLHARGGQTPLGQLEIDMQPGQVYVIACFFQDDPKSQPHHMLGMYGSIRVSGDRRPGLPQSAPSPPAASG